MISKPFDAIRTSDIEALVTNEVKEGRTIEYKQSLPTHVDKDKKEFLADVSSFANAAGGDLLYGVVEKRDAANNQTGVPVSVPGIAAIIVELEVARLDNMIRTGSGPRIAGVRIGAVDGFASGPVLHVRVPKSFNAPHMVTFQDHTRFYSRNNVGKYPLDVGEIRSAFALSESMPEKIRQFRNERLAAIVADETPVPLPPRHVRFVLHLLPIISLDRNTRVDVSAMVHTQALRPIGASQGFTGRHNLDGFVSYFKFDRAAVGISYIQLFRNGILEAVEGGVTEFATPQTNLLNFDYYEQELLASVKAYLRVLKELSIQPPVCVMFSVIGVKGYGLATREQSVRFQRPGFDRDVLLLPDVLVEDLDQPAEAVLQPIVDALWQASGWPGKPNPRA